MAIIDTYSKNVWDFYIKNKDECLKCIKEWLDEEITPLRGRDPSGFEIVLFSNMDEVHSEKVRQACMKVGVRRETTAGYTPEYNAFVERWFRTNADMSRCQIL